MIELPPINEGAVHMMTRLDFVLKVISSVTLVGDPGFALVCVSFPL